MDARRTCLVIDIDSSGEPITGELIPPGGRPRRFSGYAGLIAAVEAIRDGQNNESAPGASDGVAPGPRQLGDSL